MAYTEQVLLNSSSILHRFKRGLLILSALTYCSATFALSENQESSSQNRKALSNELIENTPQYGQLSLYSDKQNTHVDAPLLSTHVDMNINGMTARVKVKQIFENNSPFWVEGRYAFPLPEKSAVDGLTMKIGERFILGEIKAKSAARKLYQHAKISGKKASLVEQHRPNIFTNSVANIAPFETIEINIEYQQDIDYQLSHGFSIRFPMTMTPRYTPRQKQLEKFQAIHSEQSQALSQTGFLLLNSSERFDLKPANSSEQSHQISIDIQLNSGLALEKIESTSHNIIKQQISNNQFKIRLISNHAITNNNEAVQSDRDFILNWRPQLGTEPRAAAFTESFNNENYLSLMVMPPQADSAYQDQQPQDRLSREVIFVLDTSGSMAGESIKQAKKALLFGLSTLSKNDRFNLIEFNSHASQLFEQAKFASNNTIQQAKYFIQQLSADGGTEMLSAMQMALTTSSYSDENLEQVNPVRQVIFLTDGAISNESALFSAIQNQLKHSRLFTVGIGSAPNSFFMRRAAKFGKGQSIFINDIAFAESKIKQLFQQIQKPMMSNITINWPNPEEVEMWPNKISDLYADQPLWLKAKISSNNNFELNITGQTTDSLWQSQIPLKFEQTAQTNGVNKLWAREKIASIMDMSAHGKLNDADEKSITSVALKHQLVSRFTSLIAIDKTPTRIAEKLYQKQIQSLQPKGFIKQKQSNLPSNIQYPKTSLSSLLPQGLMLTSLPNNLSVILILILLWLSKLRTR
jgi:Ca-activated chloride channel homolog